MLYEPIVKDSPCPEEFTVGQTDKGWEGKQKHSEGEWLAQSHPAADLGLDSQVCLLSVQCLIHSNKSSAALKDFALSYKSIVNLENKKLQRQRLGGFIFVWDFLRWKIWFKVEKWKAIWTICVPLLSRGCHPFSLGRAWERGWGKRPGQLPWAPG